MFRLACRSRFSFAINFISPSVAPLSRPTPGRRGLLCAVLLGQALATQAAEAGSAGPSPDVLAQLYVEAFINDDPASFARLSSAQHYADGAKVRATMQALAERTALGAALENLGSFTRSAINRGAALSADQEQQLRALAQAQALAIRQVQCKVTESQVMATCSAGESPKVEVHLACQVPQIPAWPATAGGQQDPTALAQPYFAALSSAWQGPASKVVPVKLRLDRSQQGQGWELDGSHDTRGVIAAISRSLSPDAGPESRRTYIPGATDMTLNPCIYTSSSDFNNSLILLNERFWEHATPADVEQVLARFGEALPLVYDTGDDTTAFHVALQAKAALPAMQTLRKHLAHMPGLEGFRTSLLNEAIKAHNPPATIKWLLDEGAPADEYRNDGSMRPLIYAITEGADAQTIDLLVAAGADVSYYNNTEHPDLDAFRAALDTDHPIARQAIARHLPLPEHGSELMEYVLDRLFVGVQYRPERPDAAGDILPIFIERGMRLDETYCDTSTTRRYSCTPEQRSNLLDMALEIGNPGLIEFFRKKGLKPHPSEGQ
ncbi:ankyrin repeat domain-containing protein [Pseudomonas sp. CF161]|uniref:ankyrin repeat domain-containing protein n=1 Tax=Pseudomonas sp. CF161 TaxID=911241 RepID=UPI00041C4AC8|nr:ankyrin repeat domain-containing protein [Pseudomonas sp. CF161]